MAPVERREKELVRRAQAGDVDAFAELVTQFEPRVRAVLWRLLDDQRDLEEATQDTFVQAWRSLGRFRAQARLSTWLYRIAVNEGLQRRRRKRLPETELEERAAVTADSPESADLSRFLAGRIRRLPADQRAALVLRDLEGLSNREVADVLGISLAAAKSRIHRARMQIREELEEWRGE
jgi:RNA polymerase sigma-70 factor, ECF subfamily